MYTQCPDCQTAFRVTPEVLQKAEGRVRCGGCGNAFSAIDFLSDELPGAGDASPDRSAEDFAKKSKALLQTLDELAGTGNVRIEDTGVEWRVVDDEGDDERTDDPLADSGVQTSLDLQQIADPNAAPGERRYDDNSPLPDDFENEEDAPYAPPAESPRRRADDQHDVTEDFDTHQIDLSIGADDDWAELLDDDTEEPDQPTGDEDPLAEKLQAAEARQVADDSALLPELAAEIAGDLTEGSRSATSQIPLEVEEELAAIHSELAAGAAMLSKDPQAGDDAPPDTAQDEAQNYDDDTGISEPDRDATDEPDIYELTEGDDDADYADELSPDEEANIVERLRESTGAFQKQIEAAREALEHGSLDAFDESSDDDDEPDDADNEELELVDESDRPDASTGESTADEDNKSASDDDASGGEENFPDPPDTADDILSQTMIQAGIDPTQLDTENVETIVMEGEFVRGSFDRQQPADEQKTLDNITEPESLIDTYMLNKDKVRGGRRKTDPVSYGVVAGIVILALLLAAQYIHATRSDLATYGAFNQTIGPVYRALGKPVTPEWNVRGWRFESTIGNIDAEQQVLTIVSSIGNSSDQPLPYPLVHVSLTDRWEEIIGSKVLEPNEYLAGDLDPRRPVAAGDRFTAVIAIEAPSADATGFKLNVCYRVTPGRVRCATEDFKD